MVKCVKCLICGETENLALIGLSVARIPELNEDRLYPNYICKNCFEKWKEYLHKHLNKKGLELNQLTDELWNKLFRRFSRKYQSEKIIFI